MSTDILFEEIQGTDRKNIRNFFKVTAGIFIIALILNLIIKKGNFSNIATALFVGIIICIIAGIFSDIRLITQIRTDGIYVRFIPFEFSFSVYSWDNIQEIYIRKFDPLTTGIGIRMTPVGRAYVFSGDTGIQIVCKNGSKLLIGTQCPDEIADILHKLGKFRKK
ncbi:MAG TPA: hypothetical protein VJ111_04085 [Chitinophagaceae bacterium]|nr:hypothetical protein [Chitinophagaceae bacterium]